MYTEVCDNDGHLLCRIDRERRLLEIRARGVTNVIDLEMMLLPPLDTPDIIDVTNMRRAVVEQR